MITLTSIVGARPQFIKVAAVWHAIRARAGGRAVRHVLVHTGQHYDEGMSGVFFRDLELPEPDWNLGVGSGPHGEQTGRMLGGIERTFADAPPDMVLVYGDTNSTLAGGLAAAKLHIPVAHVEAGLRSFNRRMPEEINRVLVDHLSALLFCPTTVAVDHLAHEGITEGVHLVGDVMHASALRFAEPQAGEPGVLDQLGVSPQRYAVATVHRAENTDDPARLAAIVEALRSIGRELPVIWPVHPRTRAAAATAGLDLRGQADGPQGLRCVEPVAYRAMLQLQRQAAVVLTDSGGVQREAWWFGVPCVTLRDRTEWPETLEGGANWLAGSDTAAIIGAFARARAMGRVATPVAPSPAADRIADLILEFTGRDAASRS